MIHNQFVNKPKLYVNIFPSVEFDWDCLKFDNVQKIIYVRHLFEFHSSLNTKVLPKFWCFKTDGVFLNCCQSDIYKTVTDQIIDQIYLGVDNITISYGQNYSGKTYTLSGLYNQFELRGIIPRFVTELFAQQQIKEGDVLLQMWLSVVDIYENFIYDLLSKPIRQCNDIKDVRRVEVHSESHCWELLFASESRRKILQQKSYNSHIASNIVTFIIKITTLNYHELHDKFSKVHFVDLAGVETINRNPLTSFKNNPTQKDANITKTLLEIFALRSQKVNGLKVGKFSVNQRIHKLTHYLDKSLSTGSCVKLICNIRPNHEDLMITLSLLKFGMSFQNISMTKPKPYIEINYERTIENLQDQVKSLQDEILIRDLWGEVFPMKFSQDRIDFVKRAVKLFLKEELSEYELLSMVDDCSLILNVIRSISKEKSSTKMDISLQTDDDMNFKPKLSVQKSVEQSPNVSSPRQSNLKDRTASISSQKRVSFQKSKETNKTTKSDKSKKKGSIKAKEEKLVLQSTEVQVNLIEPNSKMPDMGSREGLWAQFLIYKPEIQEGIDKLNNVVIEKDKKLNLEMLKCNDIHSALNKVHRALNQLANIRYMEKKEMPDKEHTLIKTDEELSLEKELKLLQKESDIHTYKLTNAKIEWLEALEKLDIEKQRREEDFKKFCLSNNFLALDPDTSSQNGNEISQEKSISETTVSTANMESMYSYLQKLYLNKLFVN